jgi:hypothetical protein
MKETKTINVKLNGLFDASFILRFEKDAQGNEYGILTAPYVKWLTPEEQTILNRIYTISGRELACIEKHYFDNNVVTIPVVGYPVSVDMEDILQKVLPQKIHEQMLSGTFKVSKSK